MRMVWHEEERMFTCFGTREQHCAQLDWYVDLPEDNYTVVGSYHPFTNDKVLWFVWHEQGDLTALTIYKMTWGGV